MLTVDTGVSVSGWSADSVESVQSTHYVLLFIYLTLLSRYMFSPPS